MGLFDGLTDALFGKAATPPAYQPYQAQTPQYNVQLGQQGQQAQNQLGQVLQGRLSAYQQGGSTLDPAYRAAVLGNAQQEATESARLAGNQLGEQMNQYGLLNSSAMGYGAGVIGKQSQLTMQNAANYLTQQDLQGVNQLQQTGQQYLNSQQQMAQNQAQGQMQAGEFGYTAGATEHNNQYQGQVAQANAQNDQRKALLTGLFGLGKAGIEAMP